MGLVSHPAGLCNPMIRSQQDKLRALMDRLNATFEEYQVWLSRGWNWSDAYD